MKTFLDLYKNFSAYEEEIQDAVQRVLRSGIYILGSELKDLEKELAEYLQCEEVVGVGNGTDAITLSLMALNIGVGDEVIAPAFTCQATWLAIHRAGAKVVPIDVDADTWTIDTDQLEKVRTPQTKGVVPVHLFGNPCEMESIMLWAKEHQLYVIEDNAQAFGSSIRGKKTGTWGDINAHSFYPTKNLGALGDAGAISTNHPEWAEKLRSLRQYGMKGNNEFPYLGINSRLDEIQAAILRVKLRHLDQQIEGKVKSAMQLQEKLQNKDIQWQKLTKNAHHTYHLLVGRYPNREDKIADLQIPKLIHYPYDVTDWNQNLNVTYPVARQLKHEVFSVSMEVMET